MYVCMYYVCMYVRTYVRTYVPTYLPTYLLSSTTNCVLQSCMVTALKPTPVKAVRSCLKTTSPPLLQEFSARLQCLSSDSCIAAICETSVVSTPSLAARSRQWKFACDELTSSKAASVGDRLTNRLPNEASTNYLSQNDLNTTLDGKTLVVNALHIGWMLVAIMRWVKLVLFLIYSNTLPRSSVSTSVE